MIKISLKKFLVILKGAILLINHIFNSGAQSVKKIVGVKDGFDFISTNKEKEIFISIINQIFINNKQRYYGTV